MCPYGRAAEQEKNKNHCLLISQRIPDKPVFKQCAAFHNGKIHKAGAVITFVLKLVWDLSALPD